MSFVVLTVVVAVSQNATGANLDVATFKKLYLAAQSSIRDFSLEYEGTTTVQGQEHQFTGRYLWHRDNLSRGEQYVRLPNIHHMMATAFAYRNGELSALTRPYDGPWEVSNVHKEPSLHWSTTDIVRLFPRENFFPMLDTHKVTLEDDEVIDGHHCTRIYLESLDSKGKTVGSFRYWVALDCNGHIVREDSYYGPTLTHRKRIELERFESAAQSTLWMPVSCVEEQYGQWDEKEHERNSLKRIRTNEVTARTQIGVLRYTVRINSDLPQSGFVLEASLGKGLMSAVLRQRHQEFLAQKQAAPAKRKSLQEMQADLDSALREAENNRTELVAGSPLRDGPGWWGWTPWITTFCSLTLLVIVLVRRHTLA